MASSVMTIAVWPDSDGVQGSAAVKDRTRNDDYFQERLADMWMKDRGQTPAGVTYKLDRMPAGYSGWEKRRGETKHIDRYIAGHPSGKDFRSLLEAWPHFQHLIANGAAAGCQCILCSGGRNKSKSERSGSLTSGSTGEKSRYFAPRPSATARAEATTAAGSKKAKTFDTDDDTPQRGKQVDAEGIPDYYRILLDTIKAADPGTVVRDNVVDQLSPDWRAGHQMLQSVLNDWSQQPSFVPRVGELVLFIRSLDSEDGIAWDHNTQSLRPVASTGWLKNFQWEAGVVTQLPVTDVSEDDLSSIPEDKTHSITYAGFRVEPMPEPGNQSKPDTRQHKYVSLHALRPLSWWRHCLGDSKEDSWHPTVRHALSVTSSWSLLGKYFFAGSWPEATLFSQGVYLGAELIMMGDVVLLEPRPRDTQQDLIVDAMVVSSIRLRFVKLDEASDDDYDNGHPYTTCLHIAGKVYTLDPKRSFGGIGASPARPSQPGFPAQLAHWGTWFNATDPHNVRQKLEVPFTRILGRCHNKSAIRRWCATPNGEKQSAGKNQPIEISRGLAGMREARLYSRNHDQRIDIANGQSWYWAETRIEQLDLHEVNGRFVGVKDEARSKKQMAAWRQALKVLDGKKGSLNEYFAAKKHREEETQGVAASSAWGMVSSAAQADSGADGEANAMELDEAARSRSSSMQMLALDGDENRSDDELMILDE